MSESQYVIYSLYFIAGLIAGVALCYVTITKFFKGHRMQDELLKSRRDLANAQRSIDDFLKTSSDLFSQLDTSYRRYADFMHSASEKMSTVGNELFIPIEDLEAADAKIEQSHKKAENAKNNEVLATKAKKLEADDTKMATPIATATIEAEVVEENVDEDKADKVETEVKKEALEKETLEATATTAEASVEDKQEDTASTEKEVKDKKDKVLAKDSE